MGSNWSERASVRDPRSDQTFSEWLVVSGSSWSEIRLDPVARELSTCQCPLRAPMRSRAWVSFACGQSELSGRESAGQTNCIRAASQLWADLQLLPAGPSESRRGLACLRWSQRSVVGAGRGVALRPIREFEVGGGSFGEEGRLMRQLELAYLDARQ